jgi:hypothetical protein
MNYPLPNMNRLFQQLGLPAADGEIDQFLKAHTLSHLTRLENADFWSLSQSTFLREALDDDSDWTEVIDQLDARLRH